MKTRKMKAIFKHQNCCDSTVYVGHIHTPFHAADVYYCTKRSMIYIRDVHAPAADCLVGTIEDLGSDIEHGLKGNTVDIAAYYMVWDYLNPPEDHYIIIK